MIGGRVDGRTLWNGVQKRDAPKSRLLDIIFATLYLSVAEPMLFTEQLERASAAEEPRQRTDEVVGSLEDEDVPALVDRKLGGYEKARDLLGDWRPDGDLSEIIADVSSLPVRHLPPGSVCDLHWQVLAVCEAKDVPRSTWPGYWSTRLRYLDKWNKVMLFRAETTHAQCRTCFDLRKEIYGKHTAVNVKLERALALREHLRRQYHDRSIYWAWKLASRVYDATFVCIMIDSCDKAKGVWPRWPRGRYPKDIDALFHNNPRPRSILTGVAAHGWCTDFYLTDDHLEHGANHFCDCLVRTLGHMQKIAAAKGYRCVPWQASSYAVAG